MVIVMMEVIVVAVGMDVSPVAVVVHPRTHRKPTRRFDLQNTAAGETGRVHTRHSYATPTLPV